jgi:uncharacterized protein YlxW (UPF0749 family)
MNSLEELKRKTILGQEALDRTKDRLDQLRQELAHERQQRELDEEAAASVKARDRILQEISKTCVPASANHLLILLKSQGFLEVEGDSVFVKITDRYNQPSSIPLETGLPKLIQERFPHFLRSGEEAITPSKQVDTTISNSSTSSREKLEAMTDAELLSLTAQPEKMAKLVNDF